MENELEKLLEYKDGKLMLENYDLVRIANMYERSVPVFLYLLQMHLSTEYSKLNLRLNKDIIFTNIKDKRYFLPSNLNYNDIYLPNGEVLVPKNRYEEIKEKVFNFAYKKCSNKVDDIKDKTKIKDIQSIEEFYSVLDDNYLFSDYYSAIYPGIRNDWKIKISPITIKDRNFDIEKEKRFFLIKK